MTARFIAGVLGLVFLAGCTSIPRDPLRVDGSTPAAFEASWSKLVSALNAEQQNQLNTAVLLIGATKQHDVGFQGSPVISPETLRSELNGKTYEDIIQAGAATGAKIQSVSHRGGRT